MALKFRFNFTTERGFQVDGFDFCGPQNNMVEGISAIDVVKVAENWVP